jgi:hypothetical protein
MGTSMLEELLDIEVVVEVEVEVSVEEVVAVSVGVSVGVGVGVGVSVGVELLEGSGPASSPFRWTMKFAFEPGGTYTVQPVAPPAPVTASPSISLTVVMTDGSMEHGIPLQPSPSHSMEMPQSGITLRNGVVGCR